VSPYIRLSWEHEFYSSRSITASLLSLPSNFTVYGPAATADLARLNTGFKADVTKDVSLFASFDGQFSDRGNSYAGTGGRKIRFYPSWFSIQPDHQRQPLIPLDFAPPVPFILQKP